MNATARKIVLPGFVVTTITDENDPEATKVECLGEVYFIKPDPEFGGNLSLATPTDVPMGRFNLFPVVLRRDGTPWAEPTLWLMDRLENSLDPNSASDTSDNLAADLAHYCEFLEDNGIDWTVFQKQKLKRPTYRYYGHLRMAHHGGDMKLSMAQRRMSSVRAFYRWLKQTALLVPEFPAWEEEEKFVAISGAQGRTVLKKVLKTDLSLIVPKSNDPYVDTIDDGGKLRPLPRAEQEWLLDALVALDNYPMQLIHLVGMLAGARIQTILTLQVRHFAQEVEDDRYEVCIPVGPGTGVDTADDKAMVLHFPTWFYRKLHVYALSDAARRRRAKADGGDHLKQYLFLSANGAPLYESKADRRIFKGADGRRYPIKGQAVRQFMTERVLPFVRAAHPTFAYQFHDTRATFGMNLTDDKLKEVVQGNIGLDEAREFVRVRMGHESSVTTDRYLKYRGRLKLARGANADWSDHLRKLVEGAKGSIQ